MSGAWRLWSNGVDLSGGRGWSGLTGKRARHQRRSKSNCRGRTDAAPTEMP